jgi:hypothetical protein
MRKAGLKTKLTRFFYFLFLVSIVGAIIAPNFISKIFIMTAMISWMVMEFL